MILVFTKYVGAYQSEGYPPMEVVRALARRLKIVLKRRGLWYQSPAFLGYPDWQEWRPSEPENPLVTEGLSEAFHQLVLDCHQYAIVARIISLKAQLLVKDNVEGLVALNVGHFVTERQKEHDPTGYAVFKNGQVALWAAFRSGQVSGAPGITGPKDVVNGLALRFSGAPTSEIVTPEDLRKALVDCVSWSTNLRLLGVSSNAGQELFLAIVEELADLLPGVWFRVRDLLDLVKVAARAEKSSYHRDDWDWGEADYSVVFQDIIPCLRRRISGCGRQERVKRSLERIIDEIERCMNAVKPNERTIPTQAELSQRLGIKTSTMSDLWRFLRTLARACLLERRALSGSEEP